MDEMELYESRKKTARMAGVGYVVLAFAALPEMLRDSLFVAGDAAATGRNILANATLFRLSILGDIVTELSFLFLGLCLYSLLKAVRQSAARAMLAMVAIAVTMTIASTGFEIAAMERFATGDPIHGGLLLGIFRALTVPATVFFGLWMLPLGYLFSKSGFMPKTLGAILMVGSAGYVIHAGFGIIAPDIPERFHLASVVAEVATIVWLVAFGVKRPSRAGDNS
jgi:hypothetical protein